MAPPHSAQQLRDVIADGNWLAHRYDETADTIHFRWVDRSAHAAVTFLTDAELGETPRFICARAEAVERARTLQLPELRFIIHSAFCCSTMLARAFDLPGLALGVKEPVILNDLIGMQLRRVDPRQVAAAMDAALLLLARPLAAGETMVVKPANLFNPLLPALLEMRRQARLLILYAPLETFLGSVARKGMDGRLWVRELMWKLIALGHAQRFGYSEEELYRQSDLQVAALGWLAQQALFAETLARGGDRVRSLSSEVLVAEPSRCLTALRRHLDIAFDPDAVARGPGFTRHSKTGAQFGAVERAHERAEGLAAHEAEVKMVTGWGEAVAAHCGIPMQLPAPLL
jgi:hypothetical protein